MRGFLALALTSISLLTASPSLAATYSYEATFYGSIGSASCTGLCENDSIFGVPSSELVNHGTLKPYQIDVSYFASNVRRELSDGDVFHKQNRFYWDELLRVSTTINGVTITALGTGTGHWVYNDCACFYSGEDAWGYGSSITADAEGTPLAFSISLSNFARPGRVPADGPLYSSFSVSTWFGASQVSFSIGDLHVSSVYSSDGATFKMISPVPLPASLPLMATAVFAFFALTCRRKMGSLAGQ